MVNMKQLHTFSYGLLPFVLFTVILYAFFYNHHLLFAEQLRLFEWNKDYFNEIVYNPGGLSAYIGEFFTQFYHLNHFGGWILGAGVGLTGILYRNLICHWKIGGNVSWELIPITSLVFFYLNPNASLGLIFGLLITLLLARITLHEKEGKRKRLLILINLPICYFFTGIGCYLYLILIFLDEIFIEKNNISCYYLTDTDYPVRLRECPDAPILFYFKGNTNLDAIRIISIVGTRNATEYGRELTESLIKDLAKVIPDLLVVSGLAYGIDICAHRNALYNRLPTVAVLAHGLDRIYPSCHRNTAVEMLESGGLLTDFPSGTEPDRPNFLRRNRIVAGISDCTIVVESAEKGGSLVTADIAFSYGRDVYSFPGRVGDSHSKGCNNLIRQNKAGLITSADDLLSALCWDIQAGATPVQTELFFAEAETFTSEQNPVLAIMRTRNEIHINELASVLEIPVHQLSMLLFELEINGKVKALPGNLYKLS